MSFSRTGPLTLRTMEREASSMNSTRTWVTPPREPVRPRTLTTLASLTWVLVDADSCDGVNRRGRVSYTRLEVRRGSCWSEGDESSISRHPALVLPCRLHHRFSISPYISVVPVSVFPCTVVEMGGVTSFLSVAGSGGTTTPGGGLVVSQEGVGEGGAAARVVRDLPFCASGKDEERNKSRARSLFDLCFCASSSLFLLRVLVAN